MIDASKLRSSALIFRGQSLSSSFSSSNAEAEGDDEDEHDENENKFSLQHTKLASVRSLPG
jgi:hypothetical protein